MARKNAVRTVIQMTCTGELPYTYHTEKNRRNVRKRVSKADGGGRSGGGGGANERLRLRKYCPRCRSHQIFEESRR